MNYLISNLHLIFLSKHKQNYSEDPQMVEMSSKGKTVLEI